MFAATATASARLLLFGLEPHIASKLVTALPDFHAFVHQEAPMSTSEWDGLLEESRGDLIFCSAASPSLPQLLRAGRERAVPVVVVAQDPTEMAWLDAMDAGAADYIAPPFEQTQLRWVVDTNLRLPYAR